MLVGDACLSLGGGEYLSKGLGGRGFNAMYFG